ncbi:beta-glucosidase BglX [Oleiagrimonas soli]|nr:beta-glucosidase BglX [Oleiagrimonas soli]MBB6183164.1 beta-glucosidase [Oleiagrimonas soli]
MHAFVDKLLSRMTLEEKVGQLSIMGKDADNLPELIRSGRLGGTNGVLPDTDVLAYTRRLQKLAMQSRLKIPLWFMGDVNHGFRTIFPVPLALASTWDTALVERVHRAAAEEASAVGVDWTFSPMIDITRDARWGRGVEGAGEDPYLGAAMARAQIRGFQGTDLAADDTLMATAKHFVGYGAAEAGRDYNAANIPRDQLEDVYLPPFRAAVDAGVGSIMPSLTTLNGIPATADGALLNGLLRKQWHFDGLIVSDYDAVPQLTLHGVAANDAEAARMALEAGVDIDLHSGTYLKELPTLVRNGVVPEAVLDRAVRRVLEAKYRLGLFDDPYRYDDAARARRVTLSPAHRALARKAAAQSMVLLKNAHDLLPLKRDARIAVIGPLARDRATMLGQMPAAGRAADVVPILDGLRAGASDTDRVHYAEGVSVQGGDTSGIAAAVQAARRADVAVLVLGESHDLFGEGLSRSHIGLPGHQLALAKAVVATGTPTVVVLINGRPLAIPWLHDHAGAILEAWVPGDEAGPAVADVLFGKVNPSGKLPMTFPRDVGQTPIYYAHTRTGRPYDDSSDIALHYSSHYVDVANAPLYPFGYGLSYTRFAYDQLRLDRTHLSADGALQVHVRVRNTGTRRGADVVQLYVHDEVASRSPPLRLLKGFQRVMLDPGASTEVTFTLHARDLAFDRADGTWGTEPGAYAIYVGGDSTATLRSDFTLDATR